jgi:hypothetical protein
MNINATIRSSRREEALIFRPRSPVGNAFSIFYLHRVSRQRPTLAWPQAIWRELRASVNQFSIRAARAVFSVISCGKGPRHNRNCRFSDLIRLVQSYSELFRLNFFSKISPSARSHTCSHLFTLKFFSKFFGSSRGGDSTFPRSAFELPRGFNQLSTKFEHNSRSILSNSE